MKVNYYRRFSSFLIDILLLALFFMVAYYFIDDSDKVIEINENIAKISEQAIKHDISMKDYMVKFSENIYELDKERVLQTGFNILVIILYFIIVPIITKGYTLGMYILGIKISGKINVATMFLRNLVATGLLYLILSFILVYFVKDTTYFISLTILGFIQFLLVIISTFMIIYRHDKQGIQDILSGTRIVNIKEVEE